MSIVFDASALLLLLNKEPGHELVETHLSKAVMSAVNMAEVLTVLAGLGVPSADAINITSSLIADIVSFDETQAASSASLRAITKPYGLSLGDRACLALALHHQLPVITADKIWKKIKLPIDIILAR